MYLGNTLTKKHAKFHEAAPHRNGVMLGQLKYREEVEKEKAILDRKMANFNKSQKSNQMEFRNAVYGNVFRRPRSFQKYHGCWL